ncbi:MAG: acyl-CoA thioesterase [Verrucomicrobia bacterium]|nr:acyl-CoA thioesterase [Verrucomicrobiota bacterium]
MPPRLFQCAHRVQYADCTLGNHVYHARYLEWLDEARGAFFRCIGAPLAELQETGTLFVLVNYQLRYRAPARYDDLLTIQVRPAALTRVRLVLDYRLHSAAGAILLEATATYACTRLDGKPSRVPPTLALALGPWLAPEGAGPAGGQPE